MRYQVLSVLFDGVPNPEKKLMTRDSLTLAGNKVTVPTRLNRTKSELFFHSPYQDNSCNDCHQSAISNALQEKLPDLCYECHDDFKEEYSYLHGPVASGACLTCHHPHLAKNESLLVRTGREMCLYCHQPRDVARVEDHEGEEQTICIDCHNPHGGDDNFFL